MYLRFKVADIFSSYKKANDGIISFPQHLEVIVSSKFTV